MTRDEHQERAASILKDRKRLMCCWATGTGKSSVVIKFLKCNPLLKTLILVPEQNNIDNWHNEFVKFGVSEESVTVICYASLHKYENTNWGLIVFDEAPHFDTELKKKICNSINAEYVLALGAVITDEQKNSLRSVYGDFYEYTITMSMAIDQGLLPPPLVCIVHMKLNDFIYKHRFRGRQITDKEYYDILNNRVESAKSDFDSNPSESNKKKMLFAGLQRKQFIGRCKEQMTRYLCERLDRADKRYICFCASIKQAEAIGGKLAFTSKTSAKLKLLDRFNDKEINSLFVVGKLIEGQNLKDIDCGVLGSIGGTDRITVQSIGRVMRSPKPVIYVPIIDNTKDEDFAKTVTYNIPNEYIKHYKF